MRPLPSGSGGSQCSQLSARLLALLMIFFLLALAMGAFVNAISGLFVDFNPDAIIPSFGLMLVAMGVGLSVYKWKVGLGPATTVGLVLFALLIVCGVRWPLPTYQWFTSAVRKGALSSFGEMYRRRYQLESTNVSRVSVSLLPRPPHAGHSTSRNDGDIVSGDSPFPENSTSVGRTTGRSPSGTGTIPHRSQ